MPRELGDLLNTAKGQPWYNKDIEYTRVAANRWLTFKNRAWKNNKPIGLRTSEAGKDPLQKPLAKMWGGASLSPEQVPTTMGGYHQARDPQF